MTLEQDARPYQSIELVNKFFVYIAIFKYLEPKITNQNCMYEEIKAIQAMLV
jgi:hypothetical protein